MGLVATLLATTVQQNRLRAALRDRYTQVACASWEGLLGCCAREPVTVAVVDLLIGGRPGPAFDEIRQLKRRYPSVGVVAYVSLAVSRPRDLFDAGRIGVDALVLMDTDDDPRRLIAQVEQAEARGTLDVLRRALSDERPTVRDATLVAVTRANQRLTPETLARVLGIRRRVLSERLAQSGFPTPQRLLAWGRLIVAARMLEDAARSADGVALALGYPSGSAFRNTCQRYLGEAPHQIRASGGSAHVVERFMTACGRGQLIQAAMRRPGQESLQLTA